MKAGLRTILCAGLLFLPALIHATDDDSSDVEFSTAPIGTPFYRHLAHDTGLDLQELYKFERHGFSRTEIIMLIDISSATHKPLKEYGKRRLNEKVTLEDLAKEAGLNYDELLKKSRNTEREIEAKGSENLPPPVYATRKETGEEDRARERRERKKQEKERKKAEKAAKKNPQPTTAPKPSPTPTGARSELD